MAFATTSRTSHSPANMTSRAGEFALQVLMTEAESMAAAPSRSPQYVRGGHLHTESGVTTAEDTRCGYVSRLKYSFSSKGPTLQ